MEVNEARRLKELGERTASLRRCWPKRCSRTGCCHLYAKKSFELRLTRQAFATTKWWPRGCVRDARRVTFCGWHARPMVIVAVRRPRLNNNCVNGCMSWHSGIRVMGIGGLPPCYARKVGMSANDTFKDCDEMKGYACRPPNEGHSARGFDGACPPRRRIAITCGPGTS